VRAAERSLDEARQAGHPDFTAGGAFGYRGGFDPIVSLRLGIDLPIRRGKKQELLAAAAQADLEAARADLRAAETGVESEVARLAAAWEREDRLLTHTRDGLLPQTSLLLDATRTSYLAGRVPFPSVIEAFQMWLSARAEVARREAERFIAAAELAALLLPLDDAAPASVRAEGALP
jgi:outer membrane protein TolC